MAPCAARVLLELGRHEEARRLLGQAIAQAPSDPEPRCVLAGSYLETGDPQEAVPIARDAIGCAPDNPWAHRLHAVALSNAFYAAEAVQSAQGAVALAPANHESWYVLAYVQLASGRVREAIEAGK